VYTYKCARTPVALCWKVTPLGRTRNVVVQSHHTGFGCFPIVACNYFDFSTRNGGRLAKKKIARRVRRVLFTRSPFIRLTQFALDSYAHEEFGFTPTLYLYVYTYVRGHQRRREPDEFEFRTDVFVVGLVFFSTRIDECLSPCPSVCGRYVLVYDVHDDRRIRRSITIPTRIAVGVGGDIRILLRATYPIRASVGRASPYEVPRVKITLIFDYNSPFPYRNVYRNVSYQRFSRYSDSRRFT